MTQLRDQINDARQELTRALDEFARDQAEELERLAARCAEVLAEGGKLLVFGNGGSAAQAQHLAAELVNRLEAERPAMAAVALTADVAVLTSIGNDRNFDSIFSRQVEALGRPGDLALGISTSGSSPNVVAALRAADAGGLATGALLGREGLPAAEIAEISVIVRDDDTARIQEVQLFAVHLLCREVERRLHPDRAGATR